MTRRPQRDPARSCRACAPRWRAHACGSVALACAVAAALGCSRTERPAAPKAAVVAAPAVVGTSDEAAAARAPRAATQAAGGAASGTARQAVPAVVSAASGAMAVGEPLPPFVATTALSPNPALASGLAALAKSRPTRGLIKLLLADPVASRAAVRRALWHSDANVRQQAALLLVRLTAQDRRAVRGGQGEVSVDADVAAALRRSLRKEPDRDVRAQVALAAASLRAPRLVPLLVEVMQRDGAGAVRANAARALGAQGDKSVAPKLIGALRDPETSVRLRAVAALQRLRARSAVPALQTALKDQASVVQQAAARALKALAAKPYGARAGTSAAGAKRRGS